MNCVTQLQVIEWMIFLQKRSCTSMIIGPVARAGRPCGRSAQPIRLVVLAPYPSISVQVPSNRSALSPQSDSSQTAAAHQTHHRHRCTIQSGGLELRRLHGPNLRPARSAWACANTQSHQPNQLSRGLPALRAREVGHRALVHACNASWMRQGRRLGADGASKRAFCEQLASLETGS